MRWVTDNVPNVPKHNNGSDDAFNYDVWTCGPNAKKVSGGGVSYDLDKIEGIELIDAKHARQGAPSPYRDEITFPPAQQGINNDVEWEMARAKQIIDDPETPFEKYVIQCNDNSPAARAYFEARRVAAGLPLSQYEFRHVPMPAGPV